MWRVGRREQSVTCIACDREVPRDRAREYDKYGNRWDREGKTFEYLCKPCDTDLCRHSRPGLEALLVEVGAGERSQAEFLSGYLSVVEERYGPLEES